MNLDQFAQLYQVLCKLHFAMYIVSLHHFVSGDYLIKLFGRQVHAGQYCSLLPATKNIQQCPACKALGKYNLKHVKFYR